MHNKILLCPVALLILTGCASYSTDEVAHYRKVHDNIPISVRVTSNTGTSTGSRDIDEAIDRVPGLIESYLAELDIEVATSGAARHLEVALSHSAVPAMSLLGMPSMQSVKAAVVYRMPDGTSLPFKFNLPIPAVVDAKALADTIARTVVDETLLLWLPADEAMNAAPPAGRAVGDALFPESTTGEDALLPHDQPVILSWEAFPSGRMLRGAPVTAGQVSDIRYELRLGRLREYSQQEHIVYQATNLQDFVVDTPEFDLDDQVPWCGAITWSVRARFRLNGHPRITAWSREKNLASPGVGLQTRVGAPAGFDCYTKFLGTPVGADAAWAPQEPVEIAPLSANEGVASIVLTGTRCGIDNDACSADSYRKNNSALRSALEKALAKVGSDARVRDGVDILDESGFGDSRQAFTLTETDLYRWLGSEANRTTILDAGITRVLAIHSRERESQIGSEDTTGGLAREDDFSLLAGKIGGKSYSSLAMLADIIDIRSGQRVGRLDITSTGSKGGGIAFVLFVPIPYKYDDDAFEAGVARIATIGAFALMGARMGWPKKFRDAGQ